MWMVSNTTPRTATAHRFVWGNPSSVAVAKATRPRRAWGTTPSTSTRPSPPRSSARFKAKSPRSHQSTSPKKKKKRVLTFLSHPMYTKGSSACFKFFFLFFLNHLLFVCYVSIFFLCMLYHLYFFGKQKRTIFVVFLLMYICTFVYAITLFYFLSFDLHKVLTVKKTTERKDKKQNDTKVKRRKDGDVKQEVQPSPAFLLLSSEWDEVGLQCWCKLSGCYTPFWAAESSWA